MPKNIIDQLEGENSSAPNPYFRPQSEIDRIPESDEKNAARILAAFGGNLVFVDERGWGVWNDGRFSFQGGNALAALISYRLRLLVEKEINEAETGAINLSAIRAIIKDEKSKRGSPFRDMDDQECAEEAEQIWRQRKAAGLYKARKIAASLAAQKRALEICEAHCRREISDLDADPWQLVVENGAVDLKKARDAEPPSGKSPDEIEEWRAEWYCEPSRESLPTRCCGCAFVPSATCPNWEKFIELIMPDKDLRECLQRALGAMIFGRNIAQVAFFMRGAGGNGKSTLMNMIFKIMGGVGGYAAPARAAVFMEAKTGEVAGRANPEEADFPGARAILASEPNKRDTLSASTIKALTGDEVRTARNLNKGQYSYFPNAIPVIQFNRMPMIKDDDDGLRRRLVIFPFDVKLYELPREQRRNPREVERELTKEMPGILNWLIDGFRDFMHRADNGHGKPLGIDPPETMSNLRDTLLSSADPVGEFLRGYVDDVPAEKIGAGGGIRTTDVFKVFHAVAEEYGLSDWSSKAVARNLIERGYDRRRSTGGYARFFGMQWRRDLETALYINNCGVSEPVPISHMNDYEDDYAAHDPDQEPPF